MANIMPYLVNIVLLMFSVRYTAFRPFNIFEKGTVCLALQTTSQVPTDDVRCPSSLRRALTPYRYAWIAVVGWVIFVGSTRQWHCRQGPPPGCPLARRLPNPAQP